MALTPAEKQKRYRERQKEAKKAAPDVVKQFVERPFSEFLQDTSGDWDPYQFIENFHVVGLGELPDGFFDEHFKFNAEFFVGDSSMSGKPLLERMEALAGLFLDGATELYRSINAFKVQEIDERIAEIEQANLSDPQVRAKALHDIVSLQAIKAQLEGKTFRRSFAEISVKGSHSD